MHRCAYITFPGYFHGLVEFRPPSRSMDEKLILALLDRHGWVVAPVIMLAYLVAREPRAFIDLFRRTKKVPVETRYDPYEMLESKFKYWMGTSVEIIDDSEPVNQRILRDLLRARYTEFLKTAAMTRTWINDDIDRYDLAQNLTQTIRQTINRAEQAEQDIGVPLAAVIHYRKFTSVYVDTFIATAEAICLLPMLPTTEDKLNALWTVLAAVVGVVTRHVEGAFADCSFAGETYDGRVIP